jgi:hypothetical protein
MLGKVAAAGAIIWLVIWLLHFLYYVWLRKKKSNFCGLHICNYSNDQLYVWHEFFMLFYLSPLVTGSVLGWDFSREVSSLVWFSCTKLKDGLSDWTFNSSMQLYSCSYRISWSCTSYCFDMLGELV